MKNSLIYLRSILCTIKSSKSVLTSDVKMASSKYGLVSNHSTKHINQNKKLPNNAPVSLYRKRDKRIIK